MFLTLVLTGVRRFELLGLRWRDVDLLDNVLRVVESKSEEGVRSIALSPALAEALGQHWGRSSFKGEDELVFCHPERGSKVDHEWFAGEFRAALKAVGITEGVRPFHDLRHTAITHDAAAGASELAVMAKAEHRSMSTTRTYLHLAGVVFRQEAEQLERRLLGGRKSGLIPSPTCSDHLPLPRFVLPEATTSQMRALETSPFRGYRPTTLGFSGKARLGASATADLEALVVAG